MCAIAGGVPNLLHESTRLYDFPGYTHAVSVQRKAAKSCVPGRCRCHLRCTGPRKVPFWMLAIRSVYVQVVLLMSAQLAAYVCIQRCIFAMQMLTMRRA